MTRRAFLLVAALCCAISSSALAGIDYLTISAFQSERASQSLLLDITNTGERLVAVGERGHVLYSDNKGTSWQQAEVPVYATLTAVHFPTTQLGWAVGHEGVILHSRDGGASWQKQLDGYAINEQVLKLAQQRIENAQQADDDATGDEAREETSFQLEEAGYALSDAQEDIEIGPAKPLLDVWFRNEQEGFAVGSYGLLLHTDDGGQQWNLWSDRLDNPDNFHLNAITVTKSKTLLLVGEAGAMHRSLDNGQSWELLESPSEGSLFGALANEDDLLVFGLRGKLFRSQDQGLSWESLPLPEPASLTGGVVTRAGQITLVGSAGSVAYSDDGGESFNLNGRPDRLPNTALVEAADGKLIAVGFRGFRSMNYRGVN